MAGEDGGGLEGGDPVAEGIGVVSGGGPPTQPSTHRVAPSLELRAEAILDLTKVKRSRQLIVLPLRSLQPTIGWSTLKHIIPARGILNGD